MLIDDDKENIQRWREKGGIGVHHQGSNAETLQELQRLGIVNLDVPSLPEDRENLKAACLMTFPPKPLNFTLVKMLLKMAKYEVAVGGKSRDRTSPREQFRIRNGTTNKSIHGPSSGRYVNTRELTYERAAAMVAAWPHVVRSVNDAERMCARLPFVGDGVEKHILEAVDRGDGTCSQLDEYARDPKDTAAANSASSISSGAVYSDSTGDPRFVAGAKMACELASVLGIGLRSGSGQHMEEFIQKGDNGDSDAETKKEKAERRERERKEGKRPNFGANAMDLINDHGITSLEQLIESCDDLDQKGVLSATQVFGIKHHADLKEGLTPEDVAEMKAEIAKVLQTYPPPSSSSSLSSSSSSSPSSSSSSSSASRASDGWIIEQGGGARRGRGAGHDADFLITHPDLCSFAATGSILLFLIDELERRRWLHWPERRRDGKAMGDRDFLRDDLPREASSAAATLAAAATVAVPAATTPGWRMTQSHSAHNVVNANSRLGAKNGGSGPGGRLTRDDIAEYRQCKHISHLIRGIKRTGRGWQHWDRLDRVFGVWRCGGGRQEGAANSNEVSKPTLRRIDIIVVPYIEWPFALLSWTGSKVFNRLTRHLSNKMGYSLSAHGILTVTGDSEQEPKLVPYETHRGFIVTDEEEDTAARDSHLRIETEECVLRLLGIPWLPPHLRNA